MTTKDVLLNDLNTAGICVKISSPVDAREILKQISEIVGILVQESQYQYIFTDCDVGVNDGCDIFAIITFGGDVFSGRKNGSVDTNALDLFISRQPLKMNNGKYYTKKQFNELVSPPNNDNGIMIGDTSVNEQLKENDYTLDALFNIAKEYDLDITITPDNDLNVFNGKTERQSTMTVSEFKEYLHYLELHIKFLDRMK